MKRSYYLLAMAVATLCLPASGYANTISAPTETFFSVDYVSAGLGGLRDGSGSGNIVITGVNGPIIQALLFWQGPTYSTDPNIDASIIFKGSPVVGANIGFSSDNCWGYANSQAYRADVTTLVTGNGIYNVANLIKSSANINGISLVVIFDDGNPSNNRDLVLYQGNDSNISNPYDALGWNITLPGINYSSGSAYLQVHVGDGQEWLDGPLYLNGLVLEPGPNVFTGISVPDAGTAASHNGSLWDIRRWEVTSWLSTGPNTLTMTIDNASSDCLSLVAAIMDLPSAAAPPPPCDLQCPPDMVIDAGTPLNFTVTLTGTCDGHTVESIPAIGTVLPVGDTAVTCILKDPSGNTIDRCQFLVTVKASDLPPVASVTQVLNSRSTSPYYCRLASTDDKTPTSALKLFVSDSASSLVVGPFASGSIVQLKKGATAGASAGIGLVKAVITVVGDAQVYAEDTAGNLSAVVIVPVP